MRQGEAAWINGILPPLAAAAAFICVGLSVVTTRYAVAQSDTLTVAFFRNGLAFALLFPFLRQQIRGARAIARRDLIWISALGLSSFACFPLLFTAALRYAPATHGALALPAATPILTLALASLLGRERWSNRKFAGIALAALGVAIALMESRWHSETENAGNILFGDFVMACAAGTLALYNVLAKPYLERYGTLRILSVALGIGSAALLALVIFRTMWQGVIWPDFSTPQWTAILVLGIASALANWLWTWSLSRTTPTRVAVFIALNPLVAMAGAVVLLHERMTIFLGVGLCVVITGIILVNQDEQTSLSATRHKESKENTRLPKRAMENKS